MKFRKIIMASILLTSMLNADRGEVLFNTHCSSCHSEILGVDEINGQLTNVYGAPHVGDVVKLLRDETKSETEFISFIKDYINMPSKRKSLYGKRAIKDFGLMPSLNGVLNDKESTELAQYLYLYQDKNTTIQTPIASALKNKKELSLFSKHCSSCHAEILGVNEINGITTNIYAAPPVKDVVRALKSHTETQEEFVSFIKDYINMPSKRKSLYGKKAIKQFGLMPSLSGVLTDEEATKLANDLYKKY